MVALESDELEHIVAEVPAVGDHPSRRMVENIVAALQSAFADIAVAEGEALATSTGKTAGRARPAGRASWSAADARSSFVR